MNKKAQVFFFTLMLGITIFVLILALSGPIKNQIDSIRNETTIEGGEGLNCTSPLISNFDKGACVVADLTIFHFIAGTIFLAGAVITAKLLFR